MTAPVRIQRWRSKGWRLPPGAVCVDRSTPWGNPFVVGEHGTRAECVELYRKLLAGSCRIAALGYWKCTTEPPVCAFRDREHAERVMEMCRQKKVKEPPGGR